MKLIILFLINFVWSLDHGIIAGSKESAEIAKADAATKENGWFPSAVGQVNINVNNYSSKTAETKAGNLQTGQLLFNGGMDFRQENHSWNNDISLKYGTSKLGEQAFRKSTDEIDLKSIYLFDLYQGISPYSSVRFESQMTKGYTYDAETGERSVGITSTFLDPGYFTESFGFAYSPKANVLFNIGYANKQTFSELGILADDTNTTQIEVFKNEQGFEFGFDFEFSLNKVLIYKSKFLSFTNFEGAEQIDIQFKNIISAQLASWLVINLEHQAEKDYNQSKKDWMYKTLFSLGLQYTFI
jgi:hypothetical protein